MALFGDLYDQVRGVLGLDPFDLKDQKLDNWGILDDLYIDLESWLPNFEALAADPEKGPAMTRRLRVYAKNYCASICIKVGVTYITKVWTDGEAKFERFEGDWEQLAADFKANADRIKLNINTYLGLVTTTDDSGFTIAAVASPDRDPVTTPRDN